MIGSFYLLIDLGNEAMSDVPDVAAELERVKTKLLAGEDSGIIKDRNGNTVGRYALKEGEDA